MNDSTKEPVNHYLFYDTPKQILINMLNSNLCTAEQIYRAFGYSSPASALTTLNRMVNEGNAISTSGDKFKALGNIFYISNLGSELALSYLGKKSHTITDDNKQVPNYKLFSERSSAHPSHSASVTDFYYLLLRVCGYNNFIWYSSGESALVSEDEKTKVLPDASFVCSGTQYLIEQDMGTEEVKQLKTKFTNYAKVLFNCESMSPILFSINLDYRLSAKERGRYLTTINKVKVEISNLEGEIKHLKSNTDASNQTVKDALALLEQEYVGKELEYYQKRNEIFTNALSKSYDSLINKAKGAIINIDDDKGIPDTMYYRLLEGLDIYVNTHVKTQEYVEKHASTGIKAIDTLPCLLLHDMKKDFDDNPHMQAYISNKYRLFHLHNNFLIDKYIRIIKVNDVFNSYMIFDISYNNVGAYARLCHILKNYKPSDPKLELMYIFVIVGNEEQAMEISREALKNGMHPSVNSKVGIRYINISKIESLSLYHHKDYSLLEAYGIADDIVVQEQDGIEAETEDNEADTDE